MTEISTELVSSLKQNFMHSHCSLKPSCFKNKNHRRHISSQQVTSDFYILEFDSTDQNVFYHHLKEEFCTNYGNTTLQSVHKYSNHTSCTYIHAHSAFFKNMFAGMLTLGFSSRSK